MSVTARRFAARPVRTASAAWNAIWPSMCDYRVVVTNKDGAPSVSGWSSTTLRSTDGFVRQSIGTTIGASGLGSSTGYWRKN